MLRNSKSKPLMEGKIPFDADGRLIQSGGETKFERGALDVTIDIKVIASMIVDLPALLRPTIIDVGRNEILCLSNPR